MNNKHLILIGVFGLTRMAQNLGKPFLFGLLGDHGSQFRGDDHYLLLHAVYLGYLFGGIASLFLRERTMAILGLVVAAAMLPMALIPLKMTFMIAGFLFFAATSFASVGMLVWLFRELRRVRNRMYLMAGIAYALGPFAIAVAYGIASIFGGVTSGEGFAVIAFIALAASAIVLGRMAGGTVGSDDAADENEIEQTKPIKAVGHSIPSAPWNWGIVVASMVGLIVSFYMLYVDTISVGGLILHLSGPRGMLDYVLSNSLFFMVTWGWLGIISALVFLFLIQRRDFFPPISTLLGAAIMIFLGISMWRGHVYAGGKISIVAYSFHIFLMGFAEGLVSLFVLFKMARMVPGRWVGLVMGIGWFLGINWNLVSMESYEKWLPIVALVGVGIGLLGLYERKRGWD